MKYRFYPYWEPVKKCRILLKVMILFAFLHKLFLSAKFLLIKPLFHRIISGLNAQ